MGLGYTGAYGAAGAQAGLQDLLEQRYRAQQMAAMQDYRQQQMADQAARQQAQAAAHAEQTRANAAREGFEERRLQHMEQPPTEVAPNWVTDLKRGVQVHPKLGTLRKIEGWEPEAPEPDRDIMLADPEAATVKRIGSAGPKAHVITKQRERVEPRPRLSVQPVQKPDGSWGLEVINLDQLKAAPTPVPLSGPTAPRGPAPRPSLERIEQESTARRKGTEAGKPEKLDMFNLIGKGASRAAAWAGRQLSGAPEVGEKGTVDGQPAVWDGTGWVPEAEWEAMHGGAR